MTFPAGKFPVIYADPAWTFKTRSQKGEGRSPGKHYKTMTLEEIKALPVKDMAAPDCVLLMWVTGPMLEHGLEVIKAWGFKYKTLGFTWMKHNRTNPRLFSGTGYWTRANAELVLLATRGKPKRVHKDVAQAILAPRREHSRKPDELYGRIERLLKGPYLEMFARTSAPGWSVWGNETDKFQIPADALRGAPRAGQSKPRKRKH